LQHLLENGSGIGALPGRFGTIAIEVEASACTSGFALLGYPPAVPTLGVFGSPGFVLNGEPFWGQDRIELLADALKSGRAPYRSDV
jgi:hypothetical protein